MTSMPLWLSDAVFSSTLKTSSKATPTSPYGYQTGSVWPHDSAFLAMGFMFYGFRAEAARIAHDISVPASHFLFNQLPEFYTTLERDDAFPIQYIGANVPQAWAAGSAFMLTQAILGFLPDAPRDKLYIDPATELAAGHNRSGSPHRQAQARYSLLARRRNDRLRGYQGRRGGGRTLRHLGAIPGDWPRLKLGAACAAGLAAAPAALDKWLRRLRRFRLRHEGPLD
jgi:hypothetical protein